jgi:acetolactate synthase-1/2/3 large subunit
MARSVSACLADTLKKYDEIIHEQTPLLKPERLCYELGQALPDDAILLSDTGFSAVWTSGFLRMKASQSYFRAAGALGWALPAAIGAKCAAPDRPVVSFIGDGGFYYHISELETAVRYQINPVIVVNNNGGLAQVSKDIRNVFKNVPERADAQYMFGGADFVKIAEGSAHTPCASPTPGKLKKRSGTRWLQTGPRSWRSSPVLRISFLTFKKKGARR